MRASRVVCFYGSLCVSLALEAAPHTPGYGGTKQAVRGFVSSLAVTTRHRMTLTFSLCFPSLGGCSSHPCSYLRKTGNQGLHIVSSSEYHEQNDLDLFLCFPSLGACFSDPCVWQHKTSSQGLYIISISEYQKRNYLDLDVRILVQ